MIINTKLALEKANGNSELAKELFTMLINELPNALESIKSANKSNSTQELLDHAHKLHGSTAYCGVSDLKSAANNLESSIKNSTKREIQANIDEVESAIHILIKNSPTILNDTWS